MYIYTLHESRRWTTYIYGLDSPVWPQVALDEVLEISGAPCNKQDDEADSRPATKAITITLMCSLSCLISLFLLSFPIAALVLIPTQDLTLTPIVIKILTLILGYIQVQ